MMATKLCLLFASLGRASGVSTHTALVLIQQRAAVAEHVNFDEGLSTESRIGYTTSLDESGYKAVAASKSNAQMEVFTRRIVASHGATFKNELSLANFAASYNGEESNSFWDFLYDLSHADWLVGFIGNVKEVFSSTPYEADAKEETTEHKFGAVLPNYSNVTNASLSSKSDVNQSAQLPNDNGNFTDSSKSHVNESAQLANDSNATHTASWQTHVKGEQCAPFCKTSAKDWSEKCDWPSSACQDCEECSKGAVVKHLETTGSPNRSQLLKQRNNDIEAFDEMLEEGAAKKRDLEAFNELAEEEAAMTRDIQIAEEKTKHDAQVFNEFAEEEAATKRDIKIAEEKTKHDAQVFNEFWQEEAAKKRDLLSFNENVEEKEDRAQWKRHNLLSFNENDLEKIERAKWNSHRFENLAGAPLDEDGYKYVAAMKNNGDMGRFIRGVIRAHGANITDQSMLHGVVPYHSGTKNVQNYAALLRDLNGAAWLSSFEMGSGATATLDEIGYQDVVSMRSAAEMDLFVRRVLVAHVATVNSEDDLRGFIPYYSGETASQSLHKLVNELSHAKWVEHFH